MTREEASLALLLLLPIAGCAESAPPPLSCVYTEGCGCRITVQKMSCPDHLDTHLFHELAQGSPLKLDLGQGEILARSSKRLTNYFDYREGDSWTEDFLFLGGTVKVHYSPGAKCQKETGEDCEYFNVRAQIKISDAAGVRSYAGDGSCGC